MTKVARIFSLLTVIVGFAGCASDDIPFDSETCADGETRCAMNVVERCQNGKWRAWSDCAANGLTCAPIDGVAKCLSSYGFSTDSDSETETATDTASAAENDSGTDSSTDFPVDTSSDTESSNDDSSGNTNETDSAESDSDPSTDDTSVSNPDTDTKSADTDTGTDATPEDTSAKDSATTDTADTADEGTTGDDTETIDTSNDTTDTGDESTDGSDSPDSESTDPAPAVCGDGKVSPGEACDDGNDVLLDGCTPDCTPEPTCLASGPCDSVCGDGIVVDEACDDGNLDDGDGCSSDCTVEPGYTCTTECSEETCTIAFEAVYRDLTRNFPDVEIDDSICPGGHLPGAVEATLSNTGKPVAVESKAEGCIEHLEDWYSGAPDKVGELKLFEMTMQANSYVNRYGENGDRWVTDSGSISFPYQYYYNGTPVFFPLDELNTDMAPAAIPPVYGGNGDWSLFERDFVPTAPDHNFYFTSEMVYWFKHRTANKATLQIMGDDDLWVFINGQLVLDFGGTHTPLPDWEGADGKVILDSAMSASLNLVENKVYAIRIFHAERKQTSSSLRLQLSDFQSVKSTCSSN